MKKIFDWVEKRNKKSYFICRGCAEAITKPKHYSNKEGYCISCYRIGQALKNNKCLLCGGPGPIKEYYALCNKCWNNEQKLNNAYNRELARREAKRLGISLKEYKKREETEL